MKLSNLLDDYDNYDDDNEEDCWEDEEYEKLKKCKITIDFYFIW